MLPRAAKHTAGSGEKSEITPSCNHKQPTHTCVLNRLFCARAQSNQTEGRSKGLVTVEFSDNTDAELAWPGTGTAGRTGLGQCSKVTADGGRSYHNLLHGYSGRPLGMLCWLGDLWWSRNSQVTGSPVSPPGTLSV